jgi:predicted CopG family antitoxin|tara:strand:- start:507 stop:1058 length:552 start_codon:yes stop_codon:yes gene_type:complete
MVVAETMAALAVAKAAVSGVKSVIETCKDVSEISGQIDQMFHASEQINAKLTPKHKTAYNNYLTQKLNDGDEIEGESFSDVASEIIEKKQLDEQLDQMARMLNRRFGADTWDTIIETRETRIKENKVKRAKAKVKFIAKKEHDRVVMLKWLKGIGQTIIVSGVLVGFYFWIKYLISCAGKCFK